MAIVYSSLTPDYGWNEAAGVYVNLATGQFTAAADVLAEVQGVADASKAYLSGLADQLGSGTITLAQFQSLGEDEIRLLVWASEATARGGWAQLTVTDYDKINDAATNQLTYWSNLCDGIANGDVSLDGNFTRRVESYADAQKIIYQNAVLDNGKDTGHTRGQRVRGKSDSCDPCIESENPAPVPIDDVVPLGNCDGLNNCGCGIITMP